MLPGDRAMGMDVIFAFPTELMKLKEATAGSQAVSTARGTETPKSLAIT